jgi:translation elongation factor EF-1beta
MKNLADRIKAELVEMAINCTLPMDMNELDMDSIVEQATIEINAERKETILNMVLCKYFCTNDYQQDYQTLLDVVKNHESSKSLIASDVVNIWWGIEDWTVEMVLEQIDGEVSQIESLIKKIETDTPLNRIDYPALREQKEVLLTVIKTIGDGVISDQLDGIIHLIDSIQDYAVDVLGKDESEVFNFTDE